MTRWAFLDRVVRRRIALGAASLALLVLAAGWVLRDLRESSQRQAALPDERGTLQVAGLAAPVALLRDAHGVPHVDARGEADAWFALGFVHAQDRLAQMLWLRQVARGRSAENVGRRGLDADRLASALDFAGLARDEVARLEPRARRVLESYAAGVNARITRIRDGADHVPVDVARLRLPLDAWEPVDSLALLKLHAWNRDSTVDAMLVLSELIQHLEPPAANLFFPDSDDFQEVAPLDALVSAPAPSEHGWQLAAALRQASGDAARGIGSSAWVIGGGRTASGHPILAGDLHLDPTVPAAFHLDHLRGGGLEVAGATLPGVPLFWGGQNRRVAWFAVGAQAVAVDLFEEALDEKDPSRFFDGSRWRSLERREERLALRGGGEELLEVRRTDNGPLLPGLPVGRPLAVHWSGAEQEGSGFAALLEVVYAADAQALREALREHREPVLAVVYADVAGAAGVKVAGYVPRRSLPARLQPLPGRARHYQWRERVPFDALPSVRLADPQGFVVAADAPLDVRGGEPIEWLWRSGVRAARIEELLGQATRSGVVGLRQVSELQADVGGERAQRVIAQAIALVDPASLGTQAVEVLRLLQAWDGNATADSTDAAVYHVFLDELIQSLLAQRVGAALLARYLALPQTDPEQLVLVLLDAAHASAEPAQRARVSEAVAHSLRSSWLSLSYRLGANARRWAWGALHPLRFRALGDSDPTGSRSLGPFAYGGSAATVNAAAYDFSSPFGVTTASTLRLVIDLGAPGQALAAIAPGQSEHPGHPHREDGLESWLQGRAWLFATDPLLVEDNAVARLELQPLR